MANKIFVKIVMAILTTFVCCVVFYFAPRSIFTFIGYVTVLICFGIIGEILIEKILPKES